MKEVKLYLENYDGHSENDVTVVLCHKLINSGFQVRTEVVIAKQIFNLYRGGRLDVVVYKDGKLVCSIEVKKTYKGKEPKRLQHYRNITGIPALYCGGGRMIDLVVEQVKDICGNH